ncbi:hypothetical protein [Streptomyces yanii]|uniref:Uncharacterized protein n=1 Tax=Streptomyces yanii TaxID=78510 RepID=A0ABV5RPV2_9ACTN
MGLVFQTTDDPESIDLKDEHGSVGHLFYSDGLPDPEDRMDEPMEPGWCGEVSGFELGNAKGIGRHSDFKQAVAAAQARYEELVEYRRKCARIDRQRPRTVSVPSGGQPR